MNKNEIILPKLIKIRNYYDSMNSVIIQYVGKTYQAGTLITDEVDPYLATNLYFASQADIHAGQRILDAGCGTCGPSIDIAQNIKNITIDAITISMEQALAAKKFIQQANLANIINIFTADYHYIPFADNSFDLVFLFESSGYSYDQHKLFSEVYRVLKNGGKLYIKDVFRKDFLTEIEQQELEEFDNIYVQQTPRLNKMLEVIAATNFIKIDNNNLDKIVTTEKFIQKMYEYKFGFPFLTEFGKKHYREFKNLPIFFAEIQAYKPL